MKLLIIIIIIGWDNDSWGYHGNDGNFFHKTESGKPYGPLFMTSDTIGCCLNFKNNTVFYTKNGVNLGNYYLNTNTFCFKINKDLIFYNVF